LDGGYNVGHMERINSEKAKVQKTTVSNIVKKEKRLNQKKVLQSFRWRTHPDCINHTVVKRGTEGDWSTSVVRRGRIVEKK